MREASAAGILSDVRQAEGGLRCRTQKHHRTAADTPRRPTRRPRLRGGNVGGRPRYRRAATRGSERVSLSPYTGNKLWLCYTVQSYRSDRMSLSPQTGNKNGYDTFVVKTAY